MAFSATDRYLETEVLTATPQKLQLMLIDAAIRSTQRAARHFEAGKPDEAGEALVHAQQVVTELLAGINRDANVPLARKMAAVYLFVFRGLVDAGRDRKKLDDVLRVLGIERETWRRVCRETGSAETPQAPEDAHPPREPIPAPHVPPAVDLTTGESPAGFSIEA